MAAGHDVSHAGAMPQVVQLRGDIVESIHPFCAVSVCDGQLAGRVGLAADDPGPVTPWRSASKPFQLATSLEALGDPAVDERELALGAASHSAEPVHIEGVMALLGRFGLDAGGLRCGAHPPVHAPSAEAILRSGGCFTDIHNNCSGKHTFMLAAAARQGWPLDYRPADHPLQVRNRARLERLCGGPSQVATDGCGVPTFAFPLAGLARAWGALGVAMAEPGTPTAGEDPAGTARLSRIGWAMARFPELTSGTGRLDLDVVRRAVEPMAVKIGAQGVFCLALPARRLGIAVKVLTGVGEALPAAVAQTLAVLAPGAFGADEAWELLRVRNVAGAVVGGYRVAGAVSP